MAIKYNNTNVANAVSVSATGTATDEIKYITVDGTEKKIVDTVYDDTEVRGLISSEALTRSAADANLEDRINNLEARGRYLSGWNCTTGKPTSEPTLDLYTYKSGDYYIVTAVGTTNYKPNGATYTKGSTSTTVETEEVGVNDYYFYDGSVWQLIPNAQRTVNFANIGGNATDNLSLLGELSAKQPLLVQTLNVEYPINVAQGAMKLNINTSKGLVVDENKLCTAIDTTAGLKYTDGAIAVDYTQVQGKLTAGNNIQISDDNVISATGTTSLAWDNITGKPNFATVSTTGSYDDLTNKPAIPTKTSELTNDSGFLTTHQSLAAYRKSSDQDAIDITFAKSADLSTVATTGSYTDLINKPTIPTKTSELTNDSGFLTAHQSLSAYRTSAAQDAIDIAFAKSADLATVATTGSYADLSNKPTIPTKTSELTNDSGFLTEHQSLAEYRKATTQDAIDATKQAKLTAGNNIQISADNVISATGTTSLAWDNITGKPSFATVATSGSYADLSNKPTIPTKTSELTNDSGFTTNTGTVTSVAVKMNGTTKGTITSSGTIDLGTVITDISGKQDKISDIDDIRTKANGAIQSTEKGVASGVATLDSAGKVPTSQLPSYVDDVLEYDSASAFPTTGETGKIYVAKDTNKTYRWSGSAYVEISASLALGETSSTAYPGDKGKANATNIATLQTTVAGKQDTINDIDNIRSNATAGAAKVSCTEAVVAGFGFTKNTGTVTTVKMNGTSLSPTSGVVDLGTVITAHQDITGKQDKLTAGSNITITDNTISAAAYDDTEVREKIANIIDGTTTVAHASSADNYTSDGTIADALDGKQATLVAGNNITISGTTISATDTTYTAGTGLNLSGTEFSLKTASQSEIGGLKAYLDGTTLYLSTN